MSADGIAFRAADWLTALNVGLNDVEVTVPSDGRLRYRIRYPRWAAYAIGLGGILGVGFVIFFLGVGIRDYLLRHPASMLPGLSVDQHVRIAWSMALFWGVIWPWILIALHKRPLRRLMERLIAEVDAAALHQST